MAAEMRADQTGSVALSDAPGGNILGDLGATGEECPSSNHTELVDAGKCTENSAVMDGHMAAQLSTVGHDYTVANDGVMAYMAITHN